MPHRISWLMSPRGALLTLAVTTGLWTLPLTSPRASAQRGPHILRLEGAGAVSLRRDDDRDSLGAGFGVGYEYRFHEHLGVGLHGAGYYFPFDETEFQGAGVASYYGLGAGLRLHALPSSSRVDIWLEPAAKLVFTGDLKRVGADVGVGVDFLVGGAGLALGPFVRYAHVLQPDNDADGGADGMFLQFGVGLSWGNTAPVAEPAPVPPPTPQAAPEPAPAPPAPPADTDGDGIVDGRDGCPQEAEDPDGHDDGDGCPDLDNDGDQVADAQDACPNEAGVVEARGCPPPEPPPAPPAPPAQALTRTVELSQQVGFASGKTIIGPRAVKPLREVLEVLKSEPGIRRVRAVGHSDDRGDASQNQLLSERRAQAAVDWLVAHGVARGRLEAVGRGSNQALGPNDSAAARAKNRRVDFEVIDPPGGQIPVTAE